MERVNGKETVVYRERNNAFENGKAIFDHPNHVAIEIAVSLGFANYVANFHFAKRMVRLNFAIEIAKVNDVAKFANLKIAKSTVKVANLKIAKLKIAKSGAVERATWDSTWFANPFADYIANWVAIGIAKWVANGGRYSACRVNAYHQA